MEEICHSEGSEALPQAAPAGPVVPCLGTFVLKYACLFLNELKLLEVDYKAGNPRGNWAGFWN